jgi:indolepyruvate ferredoxin oxidoreductase alpha subunit
MVKLLSGNEAFARGAYESDVKVVSSYPGTPSTEITENIKEYPTIYAEWAVNEKVALEVAAGASLAGKRAMTCMKHVGLNVAADPLMTLSYTGVNGGLVIIVCDDPGMHSSQNEQDSRHYARFSKLPMLEPSDSMEAKEFLIQAFEISEKYECPILVRSTTRISHSKSKVALKEPLKVTEKNLEKNPDKWVMVPANAKKRHVVVENRLNELQNFFETYKLNKREFLSKSLGFICSGITYQYIKEIFPHASIFKLATIYPLPFESIRKFISTVENTYVIEELDPFLENELRAKGLPVKIIDRPLCGELSPDILRNIFLKRNKVTNKIFKYKNLPSRPPNLCAGCAHRGIFYAISKLKLFVTGDIGCYTLGYLTPLNAIHSCLCMGASISMAHGIDKASKGSMSKSTVAVIGDSTFLHTGINGLINAVYNKGCSTIIILDNRITAMTGHQDNPATGITLKGESTYKLNFIELAKALGIKHIVSIDPTDVEKCIEVLKEETEKEEISLLITNRACIYADRSVISNPYYVILDKCRGCKICLKLGCPAISFNSEINKASIDQTLCTGCTLCFKICKFTAITGSGNANTKDN